MNHGQVFRFSPVILSIDETGGFFITCIIFHFDNSGLSMVQMHCGLIIIS